MYIFVGKYITPPLPIEDSMLITFKVTDGVLKFIVYVYATIGNTISHRYFLTF